MKKTNLSSGFTLIELLVVVGIIMILVLVGLLNFQNAQKLGRDARRKTDIKQVQTSLEIYRADNGRYVVGSGAISSSLSVLRPNFITNFPTDPTTGRVYYYSSASGTSYTLCSILENENDTERNASACGGAAASNCAAPCLYEVVNP